MNRSAEIFSRLSAVTSEIASYHPTLIVVTKTYPASDVEILKSLGCENFGENRSSEGAEKAKLCSGRWHYQGQIQSNKIREISTWAQVIHSLDSLSHAEKFSKVALETPERQLQVFIQLSLDGDPLRGGVAAEKVNELASGLISLPGLALQGLMCVPPVDMDVSAAYQKIAGIHQKFKSEFPMAPSLSAGMSNDYMIALDHGATHIRVGSKILGQRAYPQ